MINGRRSERKRFTLYPDRKSWRAELRLSKDRGDRRTSDFFKKKFFLHFFQ
uniref:Uncharacterized protein n=1 Tax=Anguilla anguilla TaxID=7936 RepID=A0A0E9QDI5_ANGAN